MTEKYITCIIQARTNSSRLPKKALKKINGMPSICYVIDRVKKSKKIKKIILATTNNKEDSILLKIAKEKNILGFAGSENDVLERFYQTAITHNADPIIRITGDCPLIDHKIIDEIIDFFLSHKFDYVSNTIFPTYPDGQDVEIFSFRTLKHVHDNAKWKSEREHVTPYIEKNPKKFKIFNYTHNSDLSSLRWCLDDELDLKFIRAIYKKMTPKNIFSIYDILKILKKYPSLTTINCDLKRNSSYFSLLKKDIITK